MSLPVQNIQFQGLYKRSHRANKDPYVVVIVALFFLQPFQTHPLQKVFDMQPVLCQSSSDVGSLLIDQCFSTAGPRPSTGPWHQLYRAARGLRKLQYATRFR